jgi:hypothetical protein
MTWSVTAARSLIARCTQLRDEGRTEAVLRAEFQSWLRQVFPDPSDASQRIAGVPKGNLAGGRTIFERRVWFVPRYVPKSSPSLFPRKNPLILPRDSYEPAAWISDTFFRSLELQFGQIVAANLHRAQ